MAEIKELYKGIYTSHTKADLKRCGVYAIENVINRKMYIGITTRSFYTRWREHIKYFNSKKHHNNHLQNSWHRYGSENFNFRVLEFLDDYSKNEMEIVEEHYINFYDTYNDTYGYNLETIYGIKNKELEDDELIALKLELADQSLEEKNVGVFCIPLREDIERIRHLYIAEGHTSEELMNVYNIEYNVFKSIIKGMSFEDLRKNGLFDDMYKEECDIIIKYERRMDRCAGCSFYDLEYDGCEYYNIILRNCNTYGCSRYIQINEDEEWTNVGYFKKEFGVDNIDDVNNLYLEGRL